MSEGTEADAPGGAGDADFPIVFEDPADAQFTWERDDMHMPFALTPLAADFCVHVIGNSFNPHYEEFGSAFRNYAVSWNGWLYFSGRANIPEDEEKAAEARWVETLRTRIPVTRGYWEEEVLPELRGIFERTASLPIDDLPGEAAADAWLETWTGHLRAWVLHFYAIMGPYQVLDDLADAYNAAMGPGHDAEALALLGGGHHELEEVAEGIEAIAGLAATPELSAAIQDLGGSGADSTEDVDFEALRRLPGGAAFVEELERFLAEHGHLGQNHDDLRLASWGEAPRLLLSQVALRLRQPAQPAREREAALARRADELADRVRATLADRPDELAKFETVLGHAREIGYLTEGHNYWIDRMSQARLRALSMRVGGRLLRAGVIGEAGDVFFLHRDEVAEALRDGGPRHELISRRRGEHERNERRTPPYIVGKVPDKPSTGDRFDGPRVPSTEADMLRGTGASAGVVRGPARVTLSQDDFDRIQPGDVIVCPSSNPSWVPVFTIAGGLVTNTGGVLSHAAVVAREFGLPAVVGAAEATTRIADGRIVEIDGTAGTVRLL
ncbi:MAG TPA: PEP-utilizing enzyme [Candidatus Limnocylindria bacterium]|nr:PEP-utilizing enzyme [Candidatus Limnocylindria bacterium]